MPAAAIARELTWRDMVKLATRPQPVTVPMVALFAIIPIYLFIGAPGAGQTLHVPEIALDRTFSLVPGWSGIYGSLFLAALLPAFVVHQQELVRRTILAFLTIWLVAFAIFLTYPTLTPRPPKVVGDSFADWGLRLIYSSDTKYNCFPSLHVAQCYLAALICSRVHRGVGAAAIVWASLVALSTLFTKQHYVLDVLAGMVLAYLAYHFIVRSFPKDRVPEDEKRLAPALALAAAAGYGLVIVSWWSLYLLGIKP